MSIINYKTADLTIAAAASVLEDIAQLSENESARVVIVDNASGDGSAQAIADWIAGLDRDAPVDLVLSDSNSGFSGGHNQGIAHMPAAFYLLFNSDAVLRPGCLSTLLAATRAHPKAGLFAPQIEYDDGEVQTSTFRFASPASEMIRAAQTGPLTRLLKNHVVALPDPESGSQIEWASFAGILLREEMVQEIGPMDEGYFLYYEDSEYCLRARRAGWGIAHVPAARMVHFRGGSGPVKTLQKQKKRMPPYFYASRARFLYQAHGRLGLWAANLAWYLGRGVALMRALLGRRPPTAAEHEARDIWINAFNPLGPRMAPHEMKTTDLKEAEA